MSCAIPVDLDRAWFLSDVVLLAEKAEGRELHASRALLSSASPVFRAMFSSTFQEGTKDRIPIRCDYDTLKEVLRLLFHVSCDCLTTITDERLLCSMHSEADMWNLPIAKRKVLQMIRKLNDGLYEKILEKFGVHGENVECAIPQHFDSSWFLGDAEVVSSNEDRFHVSKALLSLGSSFFRNEFLVHKKPSIELQIPSTILKEILHQMHHIHCECAHSEIVDPDTLLHLHLAANWLNIPKIKETSLPRLDEFPTILMEETKRFIQGERRSLVSVCQRLNDHELVSFLSSDDPRYFFSKADLVTLLKLSPAEMEEAPTTVADLQEEDETTHLTVAVNLKDPVGGCKLFDITINTKNSGGRRLYAMKRALQRDSKFFEEKFLEDDWSEGKSPEGYDIISVDVEYHTMHRVLAAIHGCYQAIQVSTPFVYEIFQAASKDVLDVPKVRELCKKHAEKPFMEHYHLDLAAFIKFDQGITTIVKKMGSCGEKELEEWIRRSKKYVYMKDGEETLLETKPEELIFTFQNVGAIYDRLVRHFPKSPKRVPFNSNFESELEYLDAMSKRRRFK